MTTVPPTSNAAPTHHMGGSSSENTTIPSIAVMMKLDAVLTIDAWIDDGAAERARVYSPHMIPEKTKDSAKTAWTRQNNRKAFESMIPRGSDTLCTVHVCLGQESETTRPPMRWSPQQLCYQGLEGRRAGRSAYSFAKRPLNDANAPEAMATACQGVVDCVLILCLCDERIQVEDPW